MSHRFDGVWDRAIRPARWCWPDFELESVLYQYVRSFVPCECHPGEGAEPPKCKELGG